MTIVNKTKSTGHEQRRDLLGLLRFMKKWRALGDARGLIFEWSSPCTPLGMPVCEREDSISQKPCPTDL